MRNNDGPRLKLEKHMRSIVAEIATVEDNLQVTWNMRKPITMNAVESSLNSEVI